MLGSCLNADLFYSLERLHCRAARIIFNLPKDMRSSDVLIQADWHPLSYCDKQPRSQGLSSYRPGKRDPGNEVVVIN